MTESTHVTPLVRKLADQYGIPLANMSGTGAGGRVTKNDVQRAAARAGLLTLRTQQAATPGTNPVASLPSVSARTETRMSAFNGTQRVQIDPWARNPLVDDARQAVPEVFAMATSEGPAPTLFKSGDLPLWIASGADPQLLLQIPAAVRHTAATADAVTFAKLMGEYAGPDGAGLAQMTFGNNGPSDADADYYNRVLAWLRGPDAHGAGRFLGF